MRKSKMFSFITKTWNPIAMKCKHDCLYCWAEKLKKGKLKDSQRYKDLSEPKLIEKELNKRFKKGDYVFVEDMGDLFEASIPEQWIWKVFDVIYACPEAKFLLLTKNPARMFGFRLPANVMCGCTIETTHPTSLWSKAPSTYARYKAMKDLCNPHKMICIEPIMDFTPNVFLSWIEEIKPELLIPESMKGEMG